MPQPQIPSSRDADLRKPLPSIYTHWRPDVFFLTLVSSMPRWHNTIPTIKAWMLVMASQSLNQSGQVRCLKQFLSSVQEPEARHGRCRELDRMISATTTPGTNTMAESMIGCMTRSQKLTILNRSSPVSTTTT
jgi:hypothetical protein